MENMDRSQIEHALAIISEWFPEEAENINTHKELIIDHIINDTTPEPGSPLLAVEHAKREEVAEIALPTLTPCEEACGMAVAEAVLFCFGLVGLHVSNQERLARAIIRKMGGTTLRGLARAIHNISEAKGATAKAKALFKLLGEVWKAGGFSAAFKVIKHEMSWWDWMKTAAISVLQITAWFATDGVAFIAEAALSIMSAEQLIEDSIKVGKVCF